MKETRLLLALAALLYLGVIWFADPFMLGVLAALSLACLFAPVAAISIIVLLFTARGERSARPPLIIVGIILASATLVGAAIPLNRLAQQPAIAASKAYPARVAPLLETYRQTHGVYPASFTELPSAPPMPRLLRRLGYSSDGQRYFFTFAPPGGLIDVWIYDSETRQWRLHT